MWQFVRIGIEQEFKMAWSTTNMVIPLVNAAPTGGFDTSAHTVEIYPDTGTYPTGKITCTQCASLYEYHPNSTPVDETSYWVRVDGTDLFKWPPQDAVYMT